jgi:hypothetical protein
VLLWRTFHYIRWFGLRLEKAAETGFIEEDFVRLDMNAFSEDFEELLKNLAWTTIKNRHNQQSHERHIRITDYPEYRTLFHDAILEAEKKFQDVRMEIVLEACARIARMPPDDALELQIFSKNHVSKMNGGLSSHASMELMRVDCCDGKVLKWLIEQMADGHHVPDEDVEKMSLLLK